MTNTDSAPTARDMIQAAANDLKLTMTAEFVPFSQSRNKGEKHSSLNWRVTLQRDGRDVLTTDYSAGNAHCPSYKKSIKRLGHANSLMRAEAIRWECENGREAVVLDSSIGGRGKELQPDFIDVLASLVLDADVLNYSSFEDWTGSFGYDADSRKAEGVYHSCLDIALKLRNAVGENGFQKLQLATAEW